MAGSVVRILVAEETAAVRSALSEVVNAVPRALLVGVVADMSAVVSTVTRLRAEVVLLSDAAGQSGFGALRRSHPDVGVIIVASGDRASARLTMSAIGEGALGFVNRPQSPRAGEGHADVVRKLLPLVTVFLTRRAAVQSKDAALGLVRPVPTGPDRLVRRAGAVAPASIGLVAVGVSTGGPQALRALIPRLPADLGVPVLVVQHMPTMFTQMMSQTLDRVSHLSVREAQPGDRLVSGTALVAPGGRHMVIRRAVAGYQVEINDQPPVHACRPSVDVLFKSIAAHFAGAVLAVVMTGMGEDGCDGVRALKAKRCYCLTQSEASCIVYGMPQAVDLAGLSDEQVPLDMLAGRITKLVRGGTQG